MPMRDIVFMLCNRPCNMALMVTVGVGPKEAAHDEWIL